MQFSFHHYYQPASTLATARLAVSRPGQPLGRPRSCPGTLSHDPMEEMGAPEHPASRDVPCEVDHIVIGSSRAIVRSNRRHEMRIIVTNNARPNESSDAPEQLATDRTIDCTQDPSALPATANGAEGDGSRYVIEGEI